MQALTFSKFPEIAESYENILPSQPTEEMLSLSMTIVLSLWFLLQWTDSEFLDLKTFGHIWH